MVITVSTESIKGERAGRPGYTKKVEVKSMPMFRGNTEPRFNGLYMTPSPGPYWAVRATEVSEGKELTINHVKVNASRNVLLAVSVERTWKEQVGYTYVEELGEKSPIYDWYSIRAFRKTGYGGIEFHDLGLSVKGLFKEREIPTGDVIDVAGARIGTSVKVFSDKTVQLYVRMWGSEKPLK